MGSAWTWTGSAVRVDGPTGLLRLEQADGEASIRKRAARVVRRLVGAVAQDVRSASDLAEVQVDDPLMDSNFVVTDGRNTYTVTVIEVGPGKRPLLMFLDEMPPQQGNLWVVHQSVPAKPRPAGTLQSGGVICFTPGTLIGTPDGNRPIETLREGDYVRTRDSSAQEIVWIGKRRMTGARMFVMPDLRPIRISPGALGIERPEQELLVSPEHRMLVRGRTAQALFNTSEVLVPAGKLVNGSTIRVDYNIREVTYIHLLLRDHHVIWANGVETESFHPANASLASLSEADRIRLLTHYPGLEDDPHGYGSFARRNLTGSEAAILMHEAA